MTEHERNTRSLRRAADRIHKASDEDLPSALSKFGFAQNEWFNSIPRDSKMRPLPA